MTRPPPGPEKPPRPPPAAAAPVPRPPPPPRSATIAPGFAAGLVGPELARACSAATARSGRRPARVVSCPPVSRKNRTCMSGETPVVRHARGVLVDDFQRLLIVGAGATGTGGPCAVPPAPRPSGRQWPGRRHPLPSPRPPRPRFTAPAPRPAARRDVGHGAEVPAPGRSKPCPSSPPRDSRGAPAAPRSAPCPGPAAGYGPRIVLQPRG